MNAWDTHNLKPRMFFFVVFTFDAGVFEQLVNCGGTGANCGLA